MKEFPEFLLFLDRHEETTYYYIFIPFDYFILRPSLAVRARLRIPAYAIYGQNAWETRFLAQRGDDGLAKDRYGRGLYAGIVGTSLNG